MAGTVRWTIAAALVVAAGPLTAAQDWPGWRGPGRDGVVPAGQFLQAWPEAFSSAWRVAVDEGYSSPVVAGDRVFVHGRRDDAEVVTALDLATGARLWQHDYPAPFAQNTLAPAELLGPFATPAVDGGRVYTSAPAGFSRAGRPRRAP